MSYKNVRKELAEQTASDGRCKFCDTSTPHQTLVDFGARCFPCFQRYCREPYPVHERSRAANAIRKEIASMGKPLP